MYILITVLYSKNTATLEGIVFIDVCCVSLNVCGSCPSAIQPVISCGSLSCKGVDHPQSSENFSIFPPSFWLRNFCVNDRFRMSALVSCHKFVDDELNMPRKKTSSVVQGCKASPEFLHWGSRLCMQGLSRPVVKEMILVVQRSSVCFVGRRNLKKKGSWRMEQQKWKKLWIHNMEQHGPMVQWSSFQVSGPSRSLAPCGVIGHCILANWRWTTVTVKIHHKQNPSCHV